MRIPKRPVAAFLLFILLVLAPSTIAQKRTSRPKPPAPKPAAAPATTFDNLLSIDSYKVYVEIRNVGQLVNSSSFTELLEPVLKLAAPPKEFKTAVKWLTTHADAVTTSRMMLAAWPTAKNIPSVLVAIEFDSAEEAAKFEPQLNEMLLKVLPPEPAATPTSGTSASPTPQPTPAAANQTKPEPVALTPQHHVTRSGALVFVTSSPLTIKNLKPANGKPLQEDQNFRTAYDRFASETIFAFINIKGIEQEDREQIERARQERKALEEKSEAVSEASPVTPEETEAEPEFPPVASTTPSPGDRTPGKTTVEINSTPPPPPDELKNLLNSFSMAFFGGLGEAKWPEAIGIAGNLDASSFDVRALFVTSQGEKLPSLPIFPMLVSGPPLVPESPSILPADTELFVTMSLDLPKVYADFLKPRPIMTRLGPSIEPTAQTEVQTPFTFIERKLGAKLTEVLLPLLGDEVVFSMALAAEPNPTATPTATTRTSSSSPDSGNAELTVTEVTVNKAPNPIIAFSLRDKEGMRAFLPKLIDAIGFKGASGVAKTEKREDTEIVSYANVLTFAFIGNFLVISPDPRKINHVVDSYLKHETLSSDINFRNFTRWQPRQLQGQVYVSPALMESYKNSAAEPSALISDQTREFLSRLAVVSEPVTYSLSNEGNGPLHQVRVPKNLLLMAIAGMSGETNVTPMVQNERIAMGALYSVAHFEAMAKKEKGSYLTLEELISQQKVNREFVETNGYKLSLTFDGNGFEVVAVPTEYGTSGRMSFFINDSLILRGGDHGGGPSTVADKPIQQ